jgi:hypothetical protein
MSYTIRYSDPSKFNFPIIVQDDTKYNSVGTGGLTLVGRNFPGYGQAISENFIHVLENSASPVPPINPIEGQLWFDTSDPSNKKLRINDGAANNTLWRPINGLHQQATEPTNATVGDIWVNTVNSLVKVYTTDLEFQNIGIQLDGADTGAFPEEREGTDGTLYKIVVNRVNGEVVSVISSNKFTPQSQISPGITTIEVGVTLSTDDFGTGIDPKFSGTAKSADSLVQGTEEVAAIKFVRNDINQTINGQLRISKSTSALQIGSSPTFLIGTSNSGVDANFNNEIADSTFTFNVKNSLGASRAVLDMGGANRNVRIFSTTNSNSSGTGALQVTGGVGVGGSLFVYDRLYADKLIVNGTPGVNGQVLVSDGTNILWKSINDGPFTTGFTSLGDVVINSPTPSTSTSTGALIINDGGGLGVSGAVNIGSLSTATSSTGALRVAGGVSIGENLYVAGEIFSSKLTIQLTTVTTTQITTDDVIRTQNTTASTGTTTGALVIAGGVGIGGTVYLGSDLNVAGTINATIAGVATSATNITGGTAGAIVYQEAVGSRGFIGIGPADSFLRSNGTTATYATTATIYVDSAVRAERFRTARTITFTGDVTGSFVLDGTQNTGTALTIQPNSIALGTDTVGDYISTGTTTGYGISGGITGEGTTFNITSNATSSNAASTIVFRDNSGNFSAGNITAVQFNGGAQGLTNIPGLQIDNLSVRNSSLTSSTVGFVAGTGISISTASVALGDSITMTNTGVISLTGSSHLAVSASSGAVTLTNNGVQSITAVGAIGVSTSTGTITITDVGVRSITGSAFIAVSTSTGTVTITNNGVHSLSAGQGISVSGSTGTITISSDPNTITATIATTYIGISTVGGVSTFTNMGVQTLTGSAHLAVSASTGTVTITNNGVRTLTGSAYLAVSTSTGTVTITNNGVQTLTGSAFLAVSQSTGTVTITNNGVQSVSVVGALGVSASTGTITITDVGVHSIIGSANIAVSTSTGTVTITNNGVRTLTAGTDTSVSTSTGTVTVWTNSTLQSITNRGSASSNAIQITNATQATSVNTGALVVSGGVGIGGNTHIGGNLNVTGVSTFTGVTRFNGNTFNGGNVGIQGNLLTTGTVTVQGLLTVNSSVETYQAATITAQAATLDFALGNVFVATSTNVSQITLNYINVPTTIPGLIVSTTLIALQGSTAYIPSTATINTVVQSIQWQGGTPPTGNANKIDIFSLKFINNGSDTPDVIGSLSTFG